MLPPGRAIFMRRLKNKITAKEKKVRDRAAKKAAKRERKAEEEALKHDRKAQVCRQWVKPSDSTASHFILSSVAELVKHDRKAQVRRVASVDGFSRSTRQSSDSAGEPARGRSIRHNFEIL